MVLPGSVAVSPVRKISLFSEVLTLRAPVAQLTLPVMGVVTVITVHTLVGGEPGLGTGIGAPKTQPSPEQLRRLPV